MAMKTFYLDKQEARFMGVCSGIANYTGIDATWIRVGAVVVTLLGAFPWTVLAYGLAAWLAKPMPANAYRAMDIKGTRISAHDMRMSMRDIDRRMADVETYVTTTNSSLAREIEELR